MTSEKDSLGDRINAIEQQLKIVECGPPDKPWGNSTQYIHLKAYHESLLQLLKTMHQAFVVLEHKVNPANTTGSEASPESKSRPAVAPAITISPSPHLERRKQGPPLSQ